jgi:hypothetical protein
MFPRCADPPSKLSQDSKCQKLILNRIRPRSQSVKADEEEEEEEEEEEDEISVCT